MSSGRNLPRPQLPKRSVTPQSAQSSQATVTVASFQGSLPLPPPEILIEYEKAYPGATALIIEWIHSETQHRRSQELSLQEHIHQMEQQDQRHRQQIERWGSVRSTIGLVLG